MYERKCFTLTPAPFDFFFFYAFKIKLHDMK